MYTFQLLINENGIGSVLKGIAKVEEAPGL